jgi:hypothetical protein
LADRLQTSTYQDDGNIEISTTLNSDQPEISVTFYVAAVGAVGEVVVSESFTVIIACLDISSISGTFVSQNYINTAYSAGTGNIFLTEDSNSMFRIVVPTLSASESVILP